MRCATTAARTTSRAFATEAWNTELRFWLVSNIEAPPTIVAVTLDGSDLDVGHDTRLPTGAIACVFAAEDQDGQSRVSLHYASDDKSLRPVRIIFALFSIFFETESE